MFLKCRVTTMSHRQKMYLMSGAKFYYESYTKHGWWVLGRQTGTLRSGPVNQLWILHSSLTPSILTCTCSYLTTCNVQRVYSNNFKQNPLGGRANVSTCILSRYYEHLSKDRTGS